MDAGIQYLEVGSLRILLLTVGGNNYRGAGVDRHLGIEKWPQDELLALQQRKSSSVLDDISMLKEIMHMA